MNVHINNNYYYIFLLIFGGIFFPISISLNLIKFRKMDKFKNLITIGMILFTIYAYFERKIVLYTINILYYIMTKTFDLVNIFILLGIFFVFLSLFLYKQNKTKLESLTYFIGMLFYSFSIPYFFFKIMNLIYMKEKIIGVNSGVLYKLYIIFSLIIFNLSSCFIPTTFMKRKNRMIVVNSIFILDLILYVIFNILLRII